MSKEKNYSIGIIIAFFLVIIIIGLATELPGLTGTGVVFILFMLYFSKRD